MRSKYHNRDHYEIILIELMKLAGAKPRDARIYTDTEIMIHINNHLAFLNLETYSLDEIEEIINALNKNNEGSKRA